MSPVNSGQSYASNRSALCDVMAEKVYASSPSYRSVSPIFPDRGRDSSNGERVSLVTLGPIRP